MRDPVAIAVGVFITLAFFALIAYAISALRSSRKAAAALAAVAALVAALPAILNAVLQR